MATVAPARSGWQQLRQRDVSPAGARNFRVHGHSSPGARRVVPVHPDRTGGSSCGPRSALGAIPLVTRQHLFVSVLVRPTEKQKQGPRGSGGSKRCEQEATLGPSARSSPVAGTTEGGAGPRVLGWGRVVRSRESLSTKHHGPGFPGHRLSARPSARRPASVGRADWP